MDENIKIGKFNLKQRIYDTIVVGSGAAAFACALHLQKYEQNFCLVTEGLGMGTSRNTGSDKQTYYKLSLAGKKPNSVRQMAQDLFAGACMNGDTALCQAAYSAKAFYKLVDLGVPFPTNEYGEYVGYQTDHDTSQRAVSAGPLTSRYMVECLQAEAMKKGLQVFDNEYVAKLLVKDGKIKGFISIKNDCTDDLSDALTLYRCQNLVLATGGPAGLYRDSVYPPSQSGGMGFAFLAGARGANLTEWQYGLASKTFRWNLSGSYQQVLPRYFSLDADGKEHDFLRDSMTDKEILTYTFLKGYQWPFDAKRAQEGSSRIDIAVYEEILAGRRVFLDYRKNPLGHDFDFSLISQEGHKYLAEAHALLPTPIERLKMLNKKAYKLYKDNGIDLEKEALEISVAAQHCNGGLAVDMSCQTNVEGLFAIGEVAATFGVYRPGGSALNATQVDAMLAAQYIKGKKINISDLGEDFDFSEAEEFLGFCLALLQGSSKPTDYMSRLQARMSDCAAFIRDPLKIQKALEKCQEDLDSIKSSGNPGKPLPLALREHDLLITQFVYLASMLKYIDLGGSSRGSFIVRRSKKFEEPKKTELNEKILQVGLKEGACAFKSVPVRPLPQDEVMFESLLNKI
ncbi:MAG: FAD-binding protein [Clostridiales bacterium]|nr:FAD-binding protein [Clostridiales bacterium]